MKWYYWVLILVVIAIIITLVVRSNKAKQAALDQIALNTDQPKSFNPFDLTVLTAKK